MRKLKGCLLSRLSPIQKMAPIIMFLAFCHKPLIAEDFSGEVNEVKGVVEVLKSGKTQWFKAIEGLPVQTNDQIKTGERSSCNIELDDGSLIFVDENTHTSLSMLEVTADKHESAISLWIGRIIAHVEKSKSTKMKIRTPVSVASVRGTEFAVEASTAGTRFGVFEGSVSVKGAQEGVTENEDAPSADEVMVNPDEETSVAKGAAPARPQKLQEVMIRNKERMTRLKGRIQELRERLARTPPEERLGARKRALERFSELKEERKEFRDKTKTRFDDLRQQRKK